MITGYSSQYREVLPFADTLLAVMAQLLGQVPDRTWALRREAA